MRDENPNKETFRFYLSEPSACPYIEGKQEQKLFVKIDASSGPMLNDRLNHAGFRRSQNILYRPACSDCNACKAVRIPIAHFKFKKSHKRILNKNSNLQTKIVQPKATSEHFDLLMRYITARHQGGGMEDMTMQDFISMIETQGGRTYLIDYRIADEPNSPLAAFTLIDQLSDGISLIYSAFDPKKSNRSLGRFIILDHIQKLKKAWTAYPGQPLRYVYLGYYIENSPKMDYKSSFKPIETLVMGKGWVLSDDGPIKDHFPDHIPNTSWMDYLKMMQHLKL